MIINTPFSGKLNLDDANYRISNNDYIDALNVTKDAQGAGQDKIVSNILGNTLIPYSAPSGTNKVIGFHSDKVRNRAYYFLWNSNGYNTILYYDLNSNEIFTVLQSKTDSNGIDILNFNPSYKVLSVNLYYRDLDGDILFFNDGYNPPRNINVQASYGTSWKAEYLLVIKAPPIMPPKVAYENDTTVTVNNLRNVLFQFAYRYVYDNNEKSVWSSKSIVPLPQQDTLLLTEDTFTNNSRISVTFSTGAPNVKKIELAFRETTNGVTSDLYLIKSFDKTVLGLGSYDVTTYNFYNDSIYSTVDVVEAALLQDWVPQKANAGELANGNIPLYAGITEGYNKTQMALQAFTQNGSSNFFVDYAGLLFLAVCNGGDSGTVGTTLKVYLFGTGSNDANNIVSTLNNASGTYVINAQSNGGTDIGIQYINTGAGSNVISVATLLTAIKNALVVKGWTFTSLNENVLTMSYSAGFTLFSSGVKYASPLETPGVPDNTSFANAWESGYQYALQYFDAEGRTIGAQTDVDASFTTPQDQYLIFPEERFCQTFLEIRNKPPKEAVYYQVLRSNNTTYNKRLYWISLNAYSSTPADTTVQRFAYVNIDNINQYNEQIISTQGVVSYNFTAGDRIKFLSRFDADGAEIPITVVDYEVLGTVGQIQLADGTIKTGNFVKILYPTNDISTDFNFDGNENFWHYQILLYNYTSNASTNQRAFYEFGKCYGIANAGTDNAYHIGLEVTRPDLAIVSGTNGDLFYRKRKVPFNDNYSLASGGTSQDINSLLGITVTGSPINTVSYKLQTQPFNNNLPANFPTYSSTNYVFFNELTTNALVVKLTAEFTVFQSQANNNTYFNFRAIIITSTGTSVLDLFPTQTVQSQVQTTFVLDNVISVPALAKVWIASYSTNALSGDTFTINPFVLNFQVLKNAIIPIVESSFNDTYNLVTNSNGRPSVVDENARQTYFPTLIRFGQNYQFDTNINGTNRFYYENFDEYDRGFGDVMRLHVRDRYLKVYQKFKVGNVPILTQIVKDSSNNPLQANTDVLINKIQYYEGNYGIGDASTSLAWNNFADYFVDDYRGVVCRLSQNGIEPISILYHTNAFFVAKLKAYRQELNNGVAPSGQVYTGNPCIYGAFDSYTNKYILALEEINRYEAPVTTTTTAAPTTTTTTGVPTTTTTTLYKDCKCYQIIVTSDGGGESYSASLQYVDCANIGVIEEVNYLNPGTYYLCAVENSVTWVFGTGTITSLGYNCNNGCPQVTTTTTSTTTTTIAPRVLKYDTSYTDVCSGGGSIVSSFTYTGGTSICDSTSVSATEFNSLSAGSYVLYDSLYGWVNYNKSGGIGTNSMTRTGSGCTACVTTTTTTAAPTTTTTTVILNAIPVANGTTGGTGSACVNASNAMWSSTCYSPIYSVLQNLQYYTYSDSTPFNPGGTWSDGNVYGTFDSTGKFTKGGNCL